MTGGLSALRWRGLGRPPVSRVPQGQGRTRPAGRALRRLTPASLAVPSGRAQARRQSALGPDVRLRRRAGRRQGLSGPFLRGAPLSPPPASARGPGRRAGGAPAEALSPGREQQPLLRQHCGRKLRSPLGKRPPAAALGPSARGGDRAGTQVAAEAGCSPPLPPPQLAPRGCGAARSTPLRTLSPSANPAAVAALVCKPGAGARASFPACQVSGGAPRPTCEGSLKAGVSVALVCGNFWRRTLVECAA